MFPGSHILNGFIRAIPHRHKLLRLVCDTGTGAGLLCIDPVELRRDGIKALALDFDGVLAHHGAPEPIPEAIAWLERCEKTFDAGNIFILSNKPTESRREWFAEHFPAIRFISGVRKKPYPDGIEKAGLLAGVPPCSILMVDDRLLTGCLAALVAGARPCYILSPYTSLAHKPFSEIFFRLLRSGERSFVRLISLF